MQLSEEQAKTLIKLQQRFKNVYPETELKGTPCTGRYILESLIFDDWDDLLIYARGRGCDV